MKYRRLRGTQDIVPPDIEVWRHVEGVFQDRFDRYSYRTIRTPIIEPTDLFVRAVGEGSDIVTKEMYTFEDRGGRSVTLRPENTASVIRAYLENGLHRRGGVQRLCYAGPMFRYDRPQAGRYRQFHQVGAEAIGSDNPAVDVEMMELVVDAMQGLGFDALDLRLNSVGGETSRDPYRKVLLDAIRSSPGALPAEVMERYTGNPLRIFDAKDVDPGFKKQLPLISEHLAPEDADHFARVQDLLASTRVPFTTDPYLVRGLDYYTRTVFEVYHGDTGAQSALCGGGRYDALVAECGGPDTPAIGFSAGVERMVAALPSSDIDGEGLLAYVVCDSESASARSLRTAGELRALGRVETDLSLRSRKKQVQAGEKSGARFLVVAAGENETLEVRDLKRRDQLEAQEDALVSRIKERLETE